MTPKALQKLALSFEGAHEEPHFERTSFRVGKKIFATMTPDGAEAMVRVSPPELVTELLETQPDVFFSYGGFTLRNGALGVHLANIDPALMKQLLTESWKHIAPKKKAPAKKGTATRTAKRKAP